HWPGYSAKAHLFQPLFARHSQHYSTPQARLSQPDDELSSLISSKVTQVRGWRLPCTSGSAYGSATRKKLPSQTRCRSLSLSGVAYSTSAKSIRANCPTYPCNQISESIAPCFWCTWHAPWLN